LFGLAALFWPFRTLAVLVILYGVYAIIDGISSFIEMYRRFATHRTWWPQLILGVISIVAGIFVLAYPGIGAVLLLYVIAFWAVALGLMEIISSFATGQFLLIIVGVLTVLFGFVLLANPSAGALALITVIGVFAIVRGVLLLVEAARAPASHQASA
jgi:uncharacterized membrane protein HdeD (DUF308 family)